MLSVVIVSYNVSSALAECLASLPASAAGLNYEVVVVDNASTDGTVEMLQSDYSGVCLVCNSQNAGYARANNQGIAATDRSSEHIVLLNPDTVLPRAALARLADFMADCPGAGACSPRLLQRDGTPQPYAFGCDPTLGYLLRRGAARLFLRRGLHDWTVSHSQQVDWVSGACLIVRRAALEMAGALDEGYFMYFEDNDLCLRLRRAGWQVWYDPAVSITHLGGQSLRQNPAARHAYQASLRYFYARHYGRAPQVALGLALWGYNQLRRRHVKGRTDAGND